MKERTMPWWLRKRDEQRHTSDGPQPDGSHRELSQTVRRLPVKTDYTVVSAVNEKLLELLRRHMVPNVLASREEIGLCTPKEHGDMVFGIYLYDIRENGDIRRSGMQMYDSTHVQYPPVYLELSYMLTAYSGIDLRYREEENHRILVKAMQVLHDFPRLEGEDALHIEFQNLTLEQKSAVWHSLGSGFQLSLFYKITPVKLESTIVKETARVQEIRIETGQEKAPGGGISR